MAVAIENDVIDELGAICGADHVLTGRSALLNRARVPAPFPVHKWEEHMPSAVVLPTSAEQVSEVVKLANRERIPVVPRAGGTGLADGAVPLRGGIMVDIKLMDQIKEIDLEDLTVTVGPGINMQTLNRALHKYGVIYPDDPASYACSLVGGRIGTNGWSLLGGRYGHVRDLVISFEIVLPTGEIIRIGDGGGRKCRKSSVGYQLKQLFMGHQGTLGIVTEATLELVPRAECEFAAFFLYDGFQPAYETMRAIARCGLSTLTGVMFFDPEKVAYLRRDDEAYIGVPDWVQAVCGISLYGARCEVEPAAEKVMSIGRQRGGRYIGDEISSADWACRHDRYANPQHGRTKDGQVALMSWHCEDASIPYPELPAVRDEWHAIAVDLCERFDMFDDWGMFAYTNGAYKPWGDYLAEIDIGIWEMKWDDRSWAAWVDAKRDLARVSIEHGGSISACHGSCRAGEVDLVPVELGGGFEVMKTIKRALDPNNIMNPGKYLLDQAYEEA
jgi:glycolate oxidase